MPQKPGHGNPHTPDAPDAPTVPSLPGLIALTISPDLPTYGGLLVVGYDPATPVLVGYSMHFTVISTADTQTDTSDLGIGQVIEDVHKSVASGTAAQRTTFPLTGGSEWSGGGADGNVDLIAPAGNIVSSATFTILG